MWCGSCKQVVDVFHHCKFRTMDEATQAVLTMTDEERAFVELDRGYPAIKKYFDDRKLALEALAKRHGIGHHFQDDQGIVYEVVIPEWKQVPMEHIGINRTRRDGETKGSLSEKRAKELGYTAKTTSLPERQIVSEMELADNPK